MTKCVFCGQERSFHEGVHLIKNDGTVNFICSSKCRKNMLKLGRDKRDRKWTEAFRIGRDKAVLKAENAKKLEAKK